ncbi:MAG: hypothetical protein Q8900_11465 [Bacillota bacterium]|nr:hypothetical protein [Bacillota bacterium]
MNFEDILQKTSEVEKKRIDSALRNTNFEDSWNNIKVGVKSKKRWYHYFISFLYKSYKNFHIKIVLQVACIVLVLFFIPNLFMIAKNEFNRSYNNIISNIKPSDKNSKSNMNYLVLESYKKVLQNASDFFSTDDKKNIYLNDILNKNATHPLKITHFTILDMDEDKSPEVVLELSTSDNTPMYFEILHYMNDTVYGYNAAYNHLQMLKSDGTFFNDDNAFYRYDGAGYGKVIFELNGYENDRLCNMELNGLSSVSPISYFYFINNKPVTEEKYKSFVSKQDAKQDANWYEFSTKNIETKLSAKP